MNRTMLAAVMIVFLLGATASGDDSPSADDVPNENDRIESLRRQADLGWPSSQWLLAHAYETGDGVPQDYAQAARWYRAAAEQGYALAQEALGDMYSRGQNDDEAVRWYRVAVAQFHADASVGDAYAQRRLGGLYHSGSGSYGIKQDYVASAKWYRLAAEQGDPQSQRRLGDMYKAGEGVPSDYHEADRWYRRAAAQYREPKPSRVTMTLNGSSGASGEQLLHLYMVAVLREDAQRCPVSVDRVYLVDSLAKLVDQPRDQLRIFRYAVERGALKQRPASVSGATRDRAQSE